MRTHVYTRTATVATFSWLASKQKRIALYIPLQIFMVNKKYVYKLHSLF